MTSWSIMKDVVINDNEQTNKQTNKRRLLMAPTASSNCKRPTASSYSADIAAECKISRGAFPRGTSPPHAAGSLDWFLIVPVDDGSAIVTVADVMGPILLLSTTSMEHEDLDEFCRQETGAQSMQQKVTDNSVAAIRGAAASAGRMGARNWITAMV
jgi:hypothetical protein